MPCTPTAHLALETIHHQPTRGIPSWLLHIMEHAMIDRLAEVAPGTYQQQPEATYLAMQRRIGTCLIDQYIPDNPLSMGAHGYESTEKGSTTGAAEIIQDGMVIDSPEAVVEHMERYLFPRLHAAITAFDEDQRVREILADEAAAQQKIGPDILKSGYGFIGFPVLHYYTYGYVNYFMATALYPEVVERHFALQADYHLLGNRAAARAYREGHLPPLFRLDHDMADSRGTLNHITWLEKYWFPHFARSLEPLRGTGVRLIWHCDGNLMAMVPRLLACGIAGFQGFQYEDGMDYPAICRLATADSEALTIIAGVSVTRTLPMGTPADIKRELAFLVEHGPRTGLFLGGSSSITPGVPWENLQTLVEGLQYYQEHGRAG